MKINKIQASDLPKTDVVFRERPHSYWLDGRQLTGVTTLLREMGLAPDYSGVDSKVLAAKAARGTAIHQMLQDFDDGLPVSDTGEGYLDAYRRLGLEVVASEYLITDGEAVASKVDKVLADGSLADVKTTSALHRRYVEWQLSVYAHLFEAQTGVRVPHLYCIHLHGGEARLVEVDRIPAMDVTEMLTAWLGGQPYLDPGKAYDVGECLGSKSAVYEDCLRQLETAKAWVSGLEDRKRELEGKVMAAMQEAGATTGYTPEGRKVTLVREHTRETLDSRALKAQMPDVWDKYRKTSVVGATIRIS